MQSLLQNGEKITPKQWKVEIKSLQSEYDSSACDCARAAQLAANELEQPGIRPFAAGKL